MSGHPSGSIEGHDFPLSTFNDNDKVQKSQSPNSSTTSTPIQTPTQELSASIMESTMPLADQTRGRPRYKRRQPSRRYFTPPSRLQSPARPDLMLEVESMPQDPDIFADADTDYFSSTDKADGPRAFRRHFFDAMPSSDSQMSNNQITAQSIDAQLASK